ncbi:hypothetical protein HDU81_010835 [Chytriomyces hyalinus]|nr:hypothetical protein HDU81_010835 [Chytriomyces hyalinus]
MPPSEQGGSLGDNETDNAKTELATSEAKEEQQLGPALIGGSLKPRSSGSLDLQGSSMYNNLEKTAFDIFCKFLKAGQLHVIDTKQGLAVAFHNYVEGQTDDPEQHKTRNQQFSDRHLFSKRPSTTLMNSFSAAVPWFPYMLELECIKNSFDESKLALDVLDSMKLHNILQHTSRMSLKFSKLCLNSTFTIAGIYCQVLCNDVTPQGVQNFLQSGKVLNQNQKLKPKRFEFGSIAIPGIPPEFSSGTPSHGNMAKVFNTPSCLQQGSLQVQYMFIPAGTTSKAQVLDVEINHPFKNLMFECQTLWSLENPDGAIG